MLGTDRGVIEMVIASLRSLLDDGVEEGTVDEVGIGDAEYRNACANVLDVAIEDLKIVSRNVRPDNWRNP